MSKTSPSSLLSILFQEPYSEVAAPYGIVDAHYREWAASCSGELAAPYSKVAASCSEQDAPNSDLQLTIMI